MLSLEQLKTSFATKMKLYPGLFAARQCDAGIDLCDSCYEYIEALYSDEEFTKEFGGLDTKTLNSFYSDVAFKRYREGYEARQKELKKENDAMIAEGFKEYKFYKTEHIVKYIKAVKDILYNTRHKTLENNVIRLTSWLQWFRQGISKQPGLYLEPSALFFYSATQGTGKSYVVDAFAHACDKLGIRREICAMQDLSARFAPEAVRDSNCLVIEEAEFHPKLGTDINIATINKLIDRQKITYEEKLKKPKPIYTNLSLIGTTNNRYYNRRYSMVIVNEGDLDLAKMAAPTPERLTQAWIDAINYCPDPKLKFHGVSSMNKKNPFPVSDNIIKIYDMLTDEQDEKISETKGVRSIINTITKGASAPKLTKGILADLRYLIELGIAEKISAKDGYGLEVSRIKVDLTKLRDFVDADKISDERVQLGEVEQIIIDKYVRDIVFDSAAEIAMLERKIKKYDGLIEYFEKNPGKNAVQRKKTEQNMIDLGIKKVQTELKLKEIKEFVDVMQKVKAGETSSGPPD